MAQRKPARLSWSPSGVPRGATRTASRSATTARLHTQRHRERRHARHRQGALRVRPTRRARGHSPLLREGHPPRRSRRRCRVDLEHRWRAVSGRHSNRRSLPRQRAPVRRRQSDLRPRRRSSQPVGHLRCTELKAGKIDDVLAALAVHSSCEGARDCSEYIRKNRNRMRYGEFHAAGLCTSTAVVESGCKRAIGLRLKGRHVLDRPRRKRDHRPPLLPPQWPLRGLLGTAFECSIWVGTPRRDKSGSTCGRPGPTSSAHPTPGGHKSSRLLTILTCTQHAGQRAQVRIVGRATALDFRGII
jgi:hypothetical protein